MTHEELDAQIIETEVRNIHGSWLVFGIGPKAGAVWGKDGEWVDRSTFKPFDIWLHAKKYSSEHHAQQCPGLY